MGGTRTVKDSDGAVLPTWEYLGGETIALNDTTVNATIPPAPHPAEIFHIAAEGGVVYYQIAGGIASANSPGYIPEDGRVIEGPIRDLQARGLALFGTAGVSAHIQYYRENIGR